MEPSRSRLEVTHVDTSWNAPSCEGNYLEGGEIRLSEDIDLEIGTPWQNLNQLWGIIDQLLVFEAHLLINNGNETCTMTIVLAGTDGQ